ncbi:MAG: PHP domain-containing protein [Candidatus Rifleibacteriota bacterium]
MTRQNLHNHTLFSDGAFLPEEIITTAISADLEIIGISDHFYTSKVYYEFNYDQWLDKLWDKYVHCLKQLKQYYSEQIKVVAGVEIDSCLRRTTGDIDKIPWHKINTDLDYVLLEYIGESRFQGAPLTELETYKSRCEKPLILAHSDLKAIQKHTPLNDFFSILKQLKITLEIPSGERNKWFWNELDPALLAGVQLSIGTDTHRNIEEAANIGCAYDFLEQNNLLPQLLTFDE